MIRSGRNEIKPIQNNRITWIWIQYILYHLKFVEFLGNIGVSHGKESRAQQRILIRNKVNKRNYKYQKYFRTGHDKVGEKVEKQGTSNMLMGVENSAVLQNVNTEWPLDAAFPPLDIYLRAVKVSIQPNIYRSIIYNSPK